MAAFLKRIFGRKIVPVRVQDTKCDDEVYRNGKTVAVNGDLAAEVAESYAQMVSQKSGQKVDWFYMGGRAVFKAIGDLKKVDEAMYWGNDGALRGLGGAKSWYGYYPGGENHWSKG